MRTDDAKRLLEKAADLAAQRGSLIFHLDLAAATASAAFADRDIATGELATLVNDQGYSVIAFDTSPLVRPIAEARFDAAGRVTIDLAQPPPPRAETLARARMTVAAARIAGPTVRRSIVVVPSSETQEPLEAYAIAIGDNAATMIVKGHWHFSLTPDGRTIIAQQALDAAADHDIDNEPGNEVDLQSVGDIPSELHTYLSLKHGVRIKLRTIGSDARWKVDGERTSVLWGKDLR